MKEIPCKECPILAICRHKPYKRLFNECSLIREYIPDCAHREKRDAQKIFELEKILKPISWDFRYDVRYDEESPLVFEYHPESKKKILGLGESDEGAV